MLTNTDCCVQFYTDEKEQQYLIPAYFKITKKKITRAEIAKEQSRVGITKAENKELVTLTIIPESVSIFTARKRIHAVICPSIFIYARMIKNTV